MKAIYINKPGEVEIREIDMPVRKPGIGRPIMPPMATYISGMSRMIEEMRRRFIDA